MTEAWPETSDQDICPNCGERKSVVFYEIRDVPVYSVVLLKTREEALNCSKGDIKLGFCCNCDFISNLAFEPEKLSYSSDYESTQAFSSTFNQFHQNLALSLIERYNLKRERVIEIGCGQGEFLTLLVELGENDGIGFDPVYNTNRGLKSKNIHFIKDFYSEKYAGYDADFVCCKMTLEHIPNTAEFINMVYRSTSQNEDVVVFFQVPNAHHVFGNLAFWDIYYEHCSYFTLQSIEYVFSKAGFDVLNLWTEYEDQYLMVEAKPAEAPQSPQTILGASSNELMSQVVSRFANSYQHILVEWQGTMRQIKEAGQRVVLWSGGSKSVSFLNTLGLTLDHIEFVVDINPNKTGTFMAGTGQEIVSPDFLLGYKPDVVIIMNPVYRTEITNDLNQMGLSPCILTV